LKNSYKHVVWSVSNNQYSQIIGVTYPNTNATEGKNTLIICKHRISSIESNAIWLTGTPHYLISMKENVYKTNCTYKNLNIRREPIKKTACTITLGDQRD
jgi:hypothetical protein